MAKYGRVASFQVIKKLNAIESEMIKLASSYENKGFSPKKIKKLMDKECEKRALEVVADLKRAFEDEKFRYVICYMLRERGVGSENCKRRFLPVVYETINNFDEIFNEPEKE